MSIYETVPAVVMLFVIVLFKSALVNGQPLHLKVVGDKQTGFSVEIFDENKLLVTNTEEFSLQLFNNDLSTVANMPQWKGQAWTGDEHHITLQGDSYTNEFDANLSVTVTYEVISDSIVKKTIGLFQPSMPGMLYILKETARPAEEPGRYITFEFDSFPGGFVHEMFPAAGFITPDNKVVGF